MKKAKYSLVKPQYIVLLSPQVQFIGKNTKLVHTLSKKRNATNLAVDIFSVLLIGYIELGDSVIRHDIDMFGLLIHTE